MYRPLLAVVALGAALTACFRSTSSGSPAPVIQLGQARRDVAPDPGLCRIYPQDGDVSNFPAQSCRSIENFAPPFAEVLYRPRGIRRLVVCYLDGDRPPSIAGIDMFDLDLGTLNKVLLSADQPAPSNNCEQAYRALIGGA